MQRKVNLAKNIYNYHNLKGYQLMKSGLTVASIFYLTSLWGDRGIFSDEKQNTWAYRNNTSTNVWDSSSAIISRSTLRKLLPTEEDGCLGGTISLHYCRDKIAHVPKLY